MDNKITIEELAPYLPYGLKYYFDGEDLHHTVIGMDITDMGIHLISPYNDYGTCNINRGKPLVRPLSQLTQEIEHNGERVIPIMVLNQMRGVTIDKERYDEFFNEGDCYGCRWSDRSNEFYYEDQTKSFYEYPQNGLSPQLGLFAKLYEFHFDLNNWIERGLALPITS